MLRLRLLVSSLAAALVGAACLGDQATAPREPIAPMVISIGDPAVLNCPALPATSKSQVIGKNGGTLTVGPHTLTIPKGALGKDVLITGSIDGTTALSIKFEPEGLKFNTGPAATLTM